MPQIDRYIVTPGFSFHRMEADRAILLHETQSFSLMGELYVQVLSSINNRCPDIIKDLEWKYSPAEAYYALDQLMRMGYIVKQEDDTSIYTWWSSFEQGPAITKILHEPITLLSTSSKYLQLMHDAMNDAGFTKINYGIGGKVAIVACEDYLEEKTTQLLKNAFENGAHYCFPVKIYGKLLWMGPLFKKGQKPCWNCLVKALQLNRPIERYLNKNEGVSVLPKHLTSLVSLKFGINAGIFQLLHKMIHSGEGDCQLKTIRLSDLSIETHYVRTRPQCEVCGNPRAFSIQVNNPVVPKYVLSCCNDNGGYRTITPGQTWDNCKHLVSPLTGIISHIDRYAKKDHRLRPVWKATYFVNPQFVDIDREERFARNSFGKGQTMEQSRASALGEAIERYSYVYTGEEPVIRTTYNKLKPMAVDPETLQHFSQNQYVSRSQLNTLISPQKIPLPFNPDMEISWTPIWSLTSNTMRYVPLQYCYGMTPTAPDEDVCTFSSNGSAAGNCLEEAILQGFLELVERDATAIWWYNRIPRPEINIESFHNSYFNEVKKHYADLGWSVWILDITHDFQIPTVVALAKNRENRHYIIGLGCHLSMHLAIQRAITEMHQVFDQKGTHDPIWMEDDIENPYFLYPENRQSSQSVHRMSVSAQSLWENIDDCVQRVKRAGMEFLILNYTRPDIGVATVKVIVPGLRHFWKQLGPGRLYSVPVKMRWFEHELSEDRMNPKELAL